jgi:DNA polymerase elongation subunit (family B)
MSFKADTSTDDEDKVNYETILIKIFRDEETNKKEFEIIKNPDYTYYINKEGKEIDTHVQAMRIEDVDAITVKYDNLIKDISYNLGDEDFFWNCIREKKFGKMKQVLLNPNIHGADLNLEDYYSYLHFLDNDYESGINNITKSFFDIEVDSIDVVGFPSPEKAEAPINLFSIYNDERNQIIVGLLRNKNNPLIKDFEENRLSEFRKFIKNKYKEKGFDNIKLTMKFFDDEVSLIYFFFQTNNFLKPDFNGGWNSAGFDNLYFINRILVLGEDPNLIMNTTDLPFSYYIFHKDNAQDPAENNSYFLNLDYTNWVDYQKIFANLRKSKKRESYALDDISKEDLGEEKIKFKKDSTNIKNSPYEDYWEFVEYNIHDTMLLAMLERQNKDLNLLYVLSCLTNTRITHTLKKTVCIKNLARKFYFNNGWVMSDNPNITYGEERVREKKDIRGAMVADPNLNAKIGISINNIVSRYIHDHVIDFDFTSLYPSIIMVFNIDETTQLGKIIYNNEDDEDKSPELADDIICKDEIFFAQKYLSLPDIQEMDKILTNKLK